MCLGVPGRVIEIEETETGVRMGRVSFGGVIRDVCLDFVPEAAIGDYVLVHVGFALNRLDETEALKTLELLGRMGFEVEDVGQGAVT